MGPWTRRVVSDVIFAFKLENDLRVLRTISIPHYAKDSADTALANINSDIDSLMGMEADQKRDYSRQIVMHQAKRDRGDLIRMQKEFLELKNG